MIAYDDLVAALTAWRTRQGLPVAQPAAAPARAAAAPRAPARPAAPPAGGDFEDGALVEDGGYDAGDDYVMQLGGDQPGEPTAIGSAPEPPGKRGKRW